MRCHRLALIVSLAKTAPAREVIDSPAPSAHNRRS
jgi:hypothetical protein